MRTLLYCLALVSRITGHSAVDNNTCAAQRVVIKLTVEQRTEWLPRA